MGCPRFVTPLCAAVMLLGVLATPLLATSAGASDIPAQCRFLEAVGEFPEGVRRGDCVNILMGPASGNAWNRVAGLCAIEEQTSEVGNKGRCITYVREHG